MSGKSKTHHFSNMRKPVNLLSHGKYSIYQLMEMVDDTKKLFREILSVFLIKYRFALPDILENVPAAAPVPAPTPEEVATS